MKRVITILLVLVLMLTGCQTKTKIREKTVTAKEEIGEQEFDGLDDPDLLEYIQDKTYLGLDKELEKQGLYIENVEVTYVSKEYLEELSYNSQENIYFGYTLSELEKQFNGKKYIYTVDKKGKTIVKEYEPYNNEYEQVVKDVAIGTGVILLCVTVSNLTAGSAPAISFIFAASAKSATTFALSGARFGGVVNGIVEGYQTGDIKKAAKASVIGAAEGFKWGAIFGAILGGTSEGIAIKKATKSGLTMAQVAKIRQETGYSYKIIQQIKSPEELNVYKNAGAYEKIVDGKLSLVQDIDLNYKSKLGGKTVTNLERMQKGNPPIDVTTGKPFHLHHINQEADGSLAVLNSEQHLGNASVLNTPGKAKQISDAEFAKQRQSYWKSFAKYFEEVPE